MGSSHTLRITSIIISISNTNVDTNAVVIIDIFCNGMTPKQMLSLRAWMEDADKTHVLT